MGRAQEQRQAEESPNNKFSKKKEVCEVEIKEKEIESGLSAMKAESSLSVEKRKHSVDEVGELNSEELIKQNLKTELMIVRKLDKEGLVVIGQ